MSSIDYTGNFYVLDYYNNSFTQESVIRHVMLIIKHDEVNEGKSIITHYASDSIVHLEKLGDYADRCGMKTSDILGVNTGIKVPKERLDQLVIYEDGEYRLSPLLEKFQMDNKYNICGPNCQSFMEYCIGHSVKNQIEGLIGVGGILYLACQSSSKIVAVGLLGIGLCWLISYVKNSEITKVTTTVSL